MNEHSSWLGGHIESRGKNQPSPTAITGHYHLASAARATVAAAAPVLFCELWLRLARDRSANAAAVVTVFLLPVLMF